MPSESLCLFHSTVKATMSLSLHFSKANTFASSISSLTLKLALGHFQNPICLSKRRFFAAELSHGSIYVLYMAPLPSTPKPSM